MKWKVEGAAQPIGYNCFLCFGISKVITVRGIWSEIAEPHKKYLHTYLTMPLWNELIKIIWLHSIFPLFCFNTGVSNSHADEMVKLAHTVYSRFGSVSMKQRRGGEEREISDKNTKVWRNLTDTFELILQLVFVFTRLNSSPLVLISAFTV